MSSTKDSFSPEMIKIYKIFGLGSLLFVLLLSFFNERRANNSGEEKPLMRITDSDRLIFTVMESGQKMHPSPISIFLSLSIG